MSRDDADRPGSREKDQQQLERLLTAQHPCIAINTMEEEDALAVVRAAAMETRREMLVWSISRGVRDGMMSDTVAVSDTEHPAAALYYLARRDMPKLTVMLDLASHLKDERTLRLLRDLIDQCARTGSHVVLIDHSEALSPCIAASATPFELSLPDEKELERVVRRTLRERGEPRPVEVQLNRRELEVILRNLSGLTARQARQVILDAIATDHRLDAEDINAILAEKRRRFASAGMLEFIEAPVDLDEIGGLANLKRWLRQRHGALTKDAVAFGIPAPRGVLMLGVQGAGKSLAAKAVATAWQRPLMRLDPGTLFDRYIGESERRLRDALRQAEMMAPVVLWIDEIEKGFASAASLSTDGGLSKRMFGTLLTWMQEHRAPVFIIATANDIEALPPELLRKGRFDEVFFVDLPKLEARAQIFAIHLRKRKRSPGSFDLAALAAASDGFSGAEIEQAVISALHEAYSAGSEITTQSVLESLRSSPPLSVTMAEKVGALRRWAKGRCVLAE